MRENEKTMRKSRMGVVGKPSRISYYVLGNKRKLLAKKPVHLSASHWFPLVLSRRSDKVLPCESYSTFEMMRFRCRSLRGVKGWNLRWKEEVSPCEDSLTFEVTRY